MIIKASASTTSSNTPIISTSPKLVGSQLSPSSISRSSEQQMINDASHHHVHLSRHQPDANEYKENDDRLTSTSVLLPSSTHTFDETEHIRTKNDRKRSLPQTTTTTTTRDEKSSVAKEMPLFSSSLLSSNPIITTNNVQSDNNDVPSLNHHISSTTTITTSPHSISSDVSSSTRRFIPSSVDQQSNAYENDGSLPTFPSSSLLMHEQANHANDKYFPQRTSMNNDLLTKNNQTITTTTPSQQFTSEENLLSLLSFSHLLIFLDKTSSTHSSPNETQKQKTISSPSDVILSSPSKQKSENNNFSDIPTSPIKTTTNGAVPSYIPAMSSSSSSSSSLSVSTPSSAEHTTRKQLLSSTVPVPRRASVSTPGAPITLILNKVTMRCFFFSRDTSINMLVFLFVSIFRIRKAFLV